MHFLFRNTNLVSWNKKKNKHILCFNILFGLFLNKKLHLHAATCSCHISCSPHPSPRSVLCLQDLPAPPSRGPTSPLCGLPFGSLLPHCWLYGRWKLSDNSGTAEGPGHRQPPRLWLHFPDSVLHFRPFPVRCVAHSVVERKGFRFRFRSAAKVEFNMRTSVGLCPVLASVHSHLVHCQGYIGAADSIKNSLRSSGYFQATVPFCTFWIGAEWNLSRVSSLFGISFFPKES